MRLFGGPAGAGGDGRAGGQGQSGGLGGGASYGISWWRPQSRLGGHRGSEAQIFCFVPCDRA